MKKILLLGGSAQQVVAIKTAKKLGYYTVLCDYLSDNPGQYVADKYYNVSTTNVDAVYEVAKKEQVSGILPYASDPAALPAAIVAERLGLPTNPSKSVEVLGIKHKFREFLQQHNFASPKTFAFDVNMNAEEVAKNVSLFHFPIVVKPTDSSGSKGVSIINDLSQLQKSIEVANEYSRNKILIAEEFIERGFPSVIGGDIFVWNGKIELYGLMSCLRGGKGHELVPFGKKKPSLLNFQQNDNVCKELQKLVNALDIKFGELNVEILLDKNDNVHFLELGPRAGGNMIPIQLSDAYGLDLVKENVLAAMGENPQLQINEQAGCFFTYVLHSYKKGTFAGVDFSKEIEPYVYRQVIYKKIGDNVESFDGAGKACGIIFLHTDTVEQMNYFCEHIEESIIVKLEDNILRGVRRYSKIHVMLPSYRSAA